MLKNFFKWTGVFESSLSAAEYISRILSAVLVFGGSGMSAWLSQESPIFDSIGTPLAVIIVFFVSAIIISGLLLLIRISGMYAKQQQYYDKLALADHRINPLDDAFVNKVIPLEDLRLPGKMVLKNKLFKNCKFVGPGALVIIGTKMQSCTFSGCGNAIFVDGSETVTGLVALDGCSLEGCELIRTTPIFHQQEKEGLAKLDLGLVAKDDDA